MRSPAGRGLLSGTRILIAEDEVLIAFELEAVFREAGADVVGPALSLPAATRLAADAGLSAAVLDIRLNRETSQPIARRLAVGGIPFLFYTGQTDVAAIRREWPRCEILFKPAAASSLVAALAALLR